MALATIVEEEIAKYRNTLDLLNQGAIDADREFKPYRLVHGVYGQRQGGENQMVRIKLRVGRLTPTMMRALADCSEDHATGISHITTRQAIQFHYVPLAETPRLMERLEAAGMTTREACGNAVRGVVCSPLAGTRADEPFDIQPYAEQVFTHFLRGPRSADLPRKFKIGFAGSLADPQAFSNIQDIGITAVEEEGVQGFRIRAAGALGSSPQTPIELHSCLPKEQLLAACEGILRVHHRYGDRENRAKARLKFVLRQQGEEGFRALYAEQRAAAEAEGITGALLNDAFAEPAQPMPLPTVSDEQEQSWRQFNVRAHRQAGLAVVAINIPRGDIPAATMHRLADLAADLSAGDVAVSVDQNLYLRQVPIERLGDCYQALRALDLAGLANHITDVLSCPGASTCQLGVTLSKNLATLLAEELGTALAADPTIDEAVLHARIKISGCPNSCGQHHIGTIGLHGASASIGGKLVPHYVLMVGGGDEGVHIHHAQMVARIPARKVVATICELARWYGQEKQAGEDFAQWLRRLSGMDCADKKQQRAARKALKERLEPFFSYAEGELSEQDFHDIGSDQLFSLDEIGAGECMS